MTDKGGNASGENVQVTSGCYSFSGASNWTDSMNRLFIVVGHGYEQPFSFLFRIFRQCYSAHPRCNTGQFPRQNTAISNHTIPLPIIKYIIIINNTYSHWREEKRKNNAPHDKWIWILAYKICRQMFSIHKRFVQIKLCVIIDIGSITYGPFRARLPYI